MTSKTPIIAGGVAFAALALFTLPRQVRSIHADLRARAEQSLAAAGSAVGVDVDGRDVVLSGGVADEAARARARNAVATLWGVRRVVDQLQVAVAAAPVAPAQREPGTRRIGAAELPTPAAAAAAAHSSSMRVSAQLAADGAVTLSGQAPSEAARAAIVERALQIFGAARLRVRLRAQDGEEKAGWRDAVFEGLAVLQRLERGRMDVTLYRIRVGGVALDAQVEGEIATALRNVAPQDLQVAVDIDASPRRDPGDLSAGGEG